MSDRDKSEELTKQVEASVAAYNAALERAHNLPADSGDVEFDFSANPISKEQAQTLLDALTAPRPDGGVWVTTEAEWAPLDEEGGHA